ncbi:3-hydroxyacyl-CoA dehydrogenase NAD-binding domain-containing protein [Sinosporangium siamense]|uniref:3-hydroxyacyl-CoA dehydrogenase NAD binding domain-containing protein n=1 Tax=Sinosporangium siamense TaxID=1367973 RepID=A0A919RAN7_9ACTN|nr:3-hydroxyacyl-CoA dehydrogenase NAD-binding domain-containing protein [Sinosporangium siamense]GII90471.1 hypothetical protein Ssi02_07020 [Sinosporangium siamense]
MNIKRVLVVGAGAMGFHIALLCARAGLEVGCCDFASNVLDEAQRKLRERSERDIAKGRVPHDRETDACSRLRFGTCSG